jgi:hypothetical protein
MPKMASYVPFGHLQPKLWAKEGPGFKLAVWLPTTKSWESTSSRCLLKECNMALEISRRELQLWFRPCFDMSLGRGIMSVQSFGSPNWDNFGTPLWESQEKEPFGCKSRGELQRILYGGKAVASLESGPWWVKWVQVPVACPNTQGWSRMWTNPLVVSFGCKFEWDNTCLSS